MTIFSFYPNSVRPFKEHFDGVLAILKSNPNYKCYIFVDKTQKNWTLDELSRASISNAEVHQLSSKWLQIQCLLKSEMCFGSPSGLVKHFSRVRAVISKKTIFVKLRPGKVTKPSGFLLGNKTKLINIIKEFFSHALFNSFTLVNDIMDKYYCIIAYGSSHSSLIIHPSPKLLGIGSSVFAPKKLDTVLFAPTHREQNEIAPLDLLLSKDTVRNMIHKNGLKLSYSCHEHGFVPPVIKSLDLPIFNNDWGNIRCVITDYSSIGADFFNATGLSVVYYLCPNDKFLEKNELNPFFQIEVKNNSTATNLDELLDNLKSIEPISVEPDIKSEPLLNSAHGYIEVLRKKILKKVS